MNLQTSPFPHATHSHSPPHSFPYESPSYPSLFWCKKRKRPIMGIKIWLMSGFLGGKRSRLGKTICADLVLPQEGWFSCGLDLVLP